MKEFIQRKHFRIALMVILDLCAVMISSFGALLVRFDFTGTAMPQNYLANAVHCMPAYIVIAIAVMALFKLYNRVWTYASSVEFFDIIKASLVIEVLFVCGHLLFNLSMPKSYYPLMFVIMTGCFGIIRFAKRIEKAIYHKKTTTEDGKRLMIIGAGAAANVLIRELRVISTKPKIVCIIDDNKAKKNKYILGVPIVGTREDIAESAVRYDIDEIIIAMPSVSADTIREIIGICQETRKTVKILPSMTKSLTTSLSKQVREVNYEDLLGREPIKVDHPGIKGFFYGKTVLVTGGGGSIGSELCRQIMQYKPKKLLIFDIYENNAYAIQMELLRNYPKADVSTLIGSVRDYDRLEKVFRKYKPDVVYHAAAHKHVPLMEKSPNEAIKNNCLGTLNVVKLADKYMTEEFVLISTDKAVRPTNIMGATKRICEMIMQTYAKKSTNTRFAAVRFGNVLGSNGSVIPLFLKQIDEGGPVTVTHKDITRFFMTIPEAVSLVLQAGLFAKGGEIFVLDMGKPVRIYDLAENLIRMKGLRPGEDIAIEVVGLRPGEKLYEELLMDEEGLDKTDNNLIYIGKPIRIDEDGFLTKLDALIAASFENCHHIKEMTEEICGTYTITDN